MARVRTANEFRHESERAAAKQLEKTLPEDCEIIANYILPARNGGGEIDLVVVMPQGVVVLEVKHWYGQIVHVGALVEFDDGYTVPLPFGGLFYKKQMLRTTLRNAGVIGERTRVGHALVTSLPLKWPDHVRTSEFVFAIGQLVGQGPLVQALGTRPGYRTLSAREVQTVAKTLAEQTSGRDRWSIGNYLLVEPAPTCGNSQNFFGRSFHMFERDAMLRCWEIAPTEETKIRAKTLRELEAEASTLARLERFRCSAIPLVYDAFRDPANFNVYWLVHESVGTSNLTAVGSMFRQDVGFRVGVLEQLDAALSVLRKANIAHRNICSDVLQVGDGGRILLTGFEFSASGDGRTVRRSVRDEKDRPPEVKRGGPFTSSGDIYAAGKMVLDILKPGAGAMGARLKGLRSRDLRKCLESMLSENPDDRPMDLRALRDVLEKEVPL